MIRLPQSVILDKTSVWEKSCTTKIKNRCNCDLVSTIKMTCKKTVITMKITITICKVSITKLNVRQPHATPKILQEDCNHSRKCAKLASQRNVKTTDKCMKVWTQCVQTWTVNGKLIPRLKCVPPLARQKTLPGDRRQLSDYAKTQPRKSARSTRRCRTTWS